MLTVRKVGSIIEKLKEMLEEYLKKTKPKYYPPVENLLDLGYEHYTENNSIAPENTVAGKVAKEKEIEKEVEEEKVNVCKAIQGIEEKGRIAGLAEGRAAGLAEGKEALEREQKLTKFLLCDNRSDDLKRALDDPAFRQKLLEKYGID